MRVHARRFVVHYHLFLPVANYKCMATLFLLCDVLPHVCFLSRLFQRESIDLAELGKSVNTTLCLLRPYQFGCNPDDYLAKLDKQLDTIDGALKCYVSPPSPADKKRFECEIQGPFIKKLCKNIEQRFPEVELLEAFTLFDPSKLPHSFDKAIESYYGKDKVDILSKYFVSLDPHALRIYWTNFRTYMIQCREHMSMQAVLSKLATNSTMHQMYPQLSKLTQICIIIPVRTADCERGLVSAMARVKTKLRNEMKNSTLNHCLRILIEGPHIQEFDFEKVLNSWKKHGHRRLIL